MATLVLSAVGTTIGGPLGGLVGALVGRQVDSAILGTGHVSGPRLKELTVTASSYGSPVPRHFGRMRVGGEVIWATDLKEASETSGGKGQPKVTTYSYSVSFAVALSSRPLQAIGRIWADGQLLRGEAGDLKVAGKMRFYDGGGDQPVDPLIASAEGAASCPAFRGLAYVVFEDLDLSEFYNRLPTLSFEVIADEAFSLDQIICEVLPDVEADAALSGLQGFTMDGSLVDALRQLNPVFGIEADANGSLMSFVNDDTAQTAIALSEAAISVQDGDFGGAAGFNRHRNPPSQSPPEVLRYYDIDRDYQTGTQRSGGQAGPGQPQIVELAAAISATDARRMVEATKQKANWSRDSLSWRTSELDPAIAPGAAVLVPGVTGTWRVTDWEWRDTGVELALERLAPSSARLAPVGQVDAGRINPADDLPVAATRLVAFELPWDGSGAGNTPQTYAAASSPGSNWSGAALFADPGNGDLQSLGPSGRTRSVVGTVSTALEAINPLLVDRRSAILVKLAGEDMALTNASAAQLAAGANRALIGSEIIQFAQAESLGGASWRLTSLLRGRGGTEAAVSWHIPGEDFVLLDQQPVSLDAAIVGPLPGTEIVAAGRGDPDPVHSPIALQGITLRPLSPVHGNIDAEADGSVRLSWTRRARGAWQWLDGLDTPLNEEAERYLVTYGPIVSPVAAWTVTNPSLDLTASDCASLNDILPAGDLNVRQQGTAGISQPLLLGTLA